MSENIKKTLLVTLDFPPMLGGVAAYYYNFCKNLPADKIIVLAPSQAGAEEFDRAQPFTIIRLDMLRQIPNRWPNTIGSILKLASSIRWMTLIHYVNQIVKNHQIEMIAAGQILPIGTVAMVYHRHRRIPYIFFAHGLDIMLPQRFKRKKTLMKEIINHAYGIVANSHFTLDELVKLGAKKEKIVVAYPCPNTTPHHIDTATTDQFKRRLELSNHKILLTVGRLVERKGHDIVIAALPKIIKRVPNIKYMIVGDGPDRKTLEQLVGKYRLGNYVVFAGALADDDVAAALHLCDVFIMPSRQLSNGDVEGFGTVYLEANAFGKPVIGGKSGGVPEAIVDGHTGLLVKPTDIDDIAQAVIRLLTDTAYAQRLGFQGMERAHTQFNWRTQSEKIKELIQIHKPG